MPPGAGAACRGARVRTSRLLFGARTKQYEGEHDRGDRYGGHREAEGVDRVYHAVGRALDDLPGSLRVDDIRSPPLDATEVPCATRSPSRASAWLMPESASLRIASWMNSAVPMSANSAGPSEYPAWPTADLTADTEPPRSAGALDIMIVDCGVCTTAPPTAISATATKSNCQRGFLVDCRQRQQTGDQQEQTGYQNASGLRISRAARPDPVAANACSTWQARAADQVLPATRRAR